ncbi:MAG TPA: tetratricopeptide repeat protein [Planctomycetota bacterium]|nr:tetratricopeptide repeat protein [Planctomycetota bacterium]
MSGVRSAPALVAAFVALAGCGGITPVRTHFNKGVYQDAQGNPAGAVAEYRLALEEDPEDFRARFNLGAALEDLAALRLEQGRLEEATRHREEARAHYAAILATRPGDVRASANLAALEFEDADAGDPEAEARAEERLLAAARRHPDLATPRTALAARRLRKGRLDDAESALREALKVDPSDVEANDLLGRTLAAKGDVDGARKAFAEALRRDPDDLAAMLALGDLERSAGRPGDAAAWYRRAVLRRRDLLEAHLALSELDAEAGDAESALAHLLEARRLARLNPRARPHPYADRLEALARRLAEDARSESRRAP